MNKNKKYFESFRKKYHFILNNSDLSPLIKKHFNANGSWIIFIFALLENRIDPKKIFNHIKINRDEWCELFIPLYSNQQAINLYKKLEVNPVISLEQTINEFNCFATFANSFVSFIHKHNLSLSIADEQVKKMIINAFGYILYNTINFKLPFTIKQMLLDPDYDTKYLFVLNNTKLFSTIKELILANCGKKINDLIILLLGQSNELSVEE